MKDGDLVEGIDEGANVVGKGSGDGGWEELLEVTQERADGNDKDSARGGGTLE